MFFIQLAWNEYLSKWADIFQSFHASFYLTHFWLMFPFYTFWKHQNSFRFLVFSGGIKWEYWPEIGSLINFHTQKKLNLKRCLFTWMKTKTLQNKKTSKLTSDFFPCCLFSVCFPISVNKTWQLFLLSFLYCSGCIIFTTSLTTEVWKLISTW